MKINFKNNITLILGLIFVLILVLCNINNFFFWDTVQLASKHASFYYTTNFSNLLLPNEIDSGHIPTFGIYLAFIWKLFGRTLWISHLAILPFALGIVIQLYRLIQKFIPNTYWLFAFFLVLIDPTLLSQITLVSPDVALVFFFLLGVNAVLDKNRFMIMLATVFLFLTSMRGMMVSLCLLCLDTYVNILLSDNLKKIALDFIKRSFTYLPAFLIFVAFSLFHYHERGWIGFHKDSPWADCFEPVGLSGIIRNIGILGWRILDFGRIGIWLVFFILFFIYRKQILKDEKTRLLLFFFVCTLVLLPANMLWANNLIAHRYLMPIYLSFSILCANILFSDYVKEKLKYTLMIAWVVIIISGNFWIYPSGISQGWDSTLAHLPYYNLRQNAIEYLDNKEIDLTQVASFFPNDSKMDVMDLNGDQRCFSKFDRNNQYVFYSNIYNVGDEIENGLTQNYQVIQQFNKNGIFIEILEKK